jgi:predicted metal-dependent phosphoesterase TrpH
MPSRQPFTHLCQQLGQPSRWTRFDLHVHSHFSDGCYSPVQLVDLARRAGLAGLALADHDTFAGVQSARAAASTFLEIIPGVEITAEFRGKEIHLLGYFVDIDNRPLLDALVQLRSQRVQRFWMMVRRLQGVGVAVDEEELAAAHASAALGRRHLAEHLHRRQQVSSVQEAFQRYLHDRGPAMVPKVRLNAAVAIALVRAAGGVAAWAHPPHDCRPDELAALVDLGLQALEVEYPTRRPGQRRRLRDLARRFSLAVTGGSDFHGPDHPRRSLGCESISADEFAFLKSLAHLGGS